MKTHWPQSLRTKLILIILVVLIPLNLLVLVLSRRSVNNVWKELLSTYQHELGIYMTRVDDGLASVDGAIEELVRENWTELNPEATGYEVARYEVWHHLREVRKEQWLVDAAYLRTNWDSWTVVTHDSDRISTWQKEKIQTYFNGADLEAYRPMSYGVIQIDDTAFLVSNVNYYDYSFGVLIREESVTEGLEAMRSFAGERFFVTDTAGNVITGQQEEQGLWIDLGKSRQTLLIGGEEKEYQIIHCPFADIEYELVRLIPTGELRRSLPQMERLLQVFCILTLMLAPIMYVAVRRLVLKPMDALNHAMQEIEHENLDYRIAEETSSYEFRYMDTVFNGMVDQIRNLKIESYEKDIEKLKIEATNLRLQINPHLLLNSLNMIYSLAQSRNYDVITAYTMNLVEYFRYSLRKSDDLVPLSAEMGFVKHYLDIQKIRFPEAFTSVYDMEDELGQVLIPPLIIENFVENAIKYALKLGETIEINIVIRQEEDYVAISVIDTGNGMAEEILEKIRREEVIVDRIGNHIGILNCRQRLRMFYGEQAEMTISSVLGEGTQVWMRLPLAWEKQPEERKG